MADDSHAGCRMILDRPDLCLVGGNPVTSIIFEKSASWTVSPEGRLSLGRAMREPLRGGRMLWKIRQILEVSALLRDVGDSSATTRMRLICAASRTASLFFTLDIRSPDARPSDDTDSPGWLSLLASARPPAEAWLADRLAALWPDLVRDTPCEETDFAKCSPVEFRELGRWLVRNWSLIGPSECLMAAGGDARLLLDPATGLNHYGCSHRPRPWAVTFASSTASSVSERGFAAAERARIRLQTALLFDRGQDALQDMARETRAFLARYYGLPDGEHVILTPSGTDCELAALAIAELNPDRRPVTNILIAPEETGRGVPLAAEGRHFAQDTARTASVPRGMPIDGFGRAGQAVERVIPLRKPDGEEVERSALMAACREAVTQAVAEGRHALLHQLDLSKTGLLALDEADMAGLSNEFGPACDIVVDACQARLMPQRIAAWVGRGQGVMITGSKFFTGPPFCGALLLPVAWLSRLREGGLPSGLHVYAGRSEWPDSPACRCLAGTVNHGLLLRWAAAHAEMAALAAVPRIEVRRRLVRFLNGVRDAISRRDDVILLETSAPARPFLEEAWDDMATILSFLVRAPGAEDGTGEFVPLSVAEARQLYHWLNADLRPVFSPDDPDCRNPVLGLLCHIGQPVAIPSEMLTGRRAGTEPDTAGSGYAGALRISAGARLISGEPSHADLGTEVRLAQEISDARAIFDKISLIRRHWTELARLDPRPTYAPVGLPGISDLNDFRAVSQSDGESKW